MLGFSHLFDGLKWIAKGFVRVILKLHEIIPDEVEQAAIKAVEQAALNATLDNTGKREWAVQEIMKTGISESIARLSVEIAVTGIKNKLLTIDGPTS